MASSISSAETSSAKSPIFCRKKSISSFTHERRPPSHRNRPPRDLLRGRRADLSGNDASTCLSGRNPRADLAIAARRACGISETWELVHRAHGNRRHCMRSRLAWSRPTNRMGPPPRHRHSHRESYWRHVEYISARRLAHLDRSPGRRLDDLVSDLGGTCFCTSQIMKAERQFKKVGRAEARPSERDHPRIVFIPIEMIRSRASPNGDYR